MIRKQPACYSAKMPWTYTARVTKGSRHYAPTGVFDFIEVDAADVPPGVPLFASRGEAKRAAVMARDKPQLSRFSAERLTS